MTTEERRAVPGLTPVSDVLGFEARLTALEAETAQLRAVIAAQATCIAALNRTLAGSLDSIRISLAVANITNERLLRLENARPEGILARLAKIDLGGEMP